MMLDVFIIGFGKAGQLHYKIFKQCQSLSLINGVYFFDPFIPYEIHHENIRINRTFLDQIEWNDNLILDVCSDTDNHSEWIDFALKKNIKKVIIEKPLVTSIDDLGMVFTQKGRFNSVVVNYNYLLSPILAEITQIIQKSKLAVKAIDTNFSKNRLIDSQNKRGVNKRGDQLHNYLIEIPHQLSIAFKLLGPVYKIEKCISEDMVHHGKIFRNHGRGLIVLKHEGGVKSTHYSDLQGQKTIREIVIHTYENVTIRGNFGQSPDYIGTIEVIKEQQTILMSSLLDQSLNTFLIETLNFFNGVSLNPCNLDYAMSINQMLLDGISKSVSDT